MINKDQDLCAGHWESEWKFFFFDNDQDEPDLPKSPEIKTQSDLPNDETYTTPSTVPENYPKIVLKRTRYLTEQIRIMILTLLWKRVWSTLALAPPTPAAQSTTYPKLDCNDDNWFWKSCNSRTVSKYIVVFRERKRIWILRRSFKLIVTWKDVASISIRGWKNKPYRRRIGQFF